MLKIEIIFKYFKFIYFLINLIYLSEFLIKISSKGPKSLLKLFLSNETSLH